ncbi:ribosome biogenesis protein tsr1 [Rickenella mellea]|uniref:Ribosome biogenesis protein tsr1 n=1 Tax=Rickenella mellea TaxID=50990 RepID=A0A4Y7QG50_9AGAM|nr:ribosome biogenesis protein tsr1 [Rickenella mellea]
MVGAHHHRPTLKQTNKAFKSKHATKSSIKEQAKGRAPRQPVKATPASASAAQLRANRKNAAKQVQLKKRQSLVSATRLFSGVDGTPRIVAVVPLTLDANAKAAVSALAQSLDVDSDDCPEGGLWKLKAERFKTSAQFINLPYGQFYSTLDACKAADYVLFVLSPTTEVDEWGDTLLRTLQAQGLPEVLSCITPSLPSSSVPSPTDTKLRAGILKSLLSFMQYFVPTQTRVYDFGLSSDCTNALRALCEGRPADVRWREGRSWLLAEGVSWVETADSKGNLSIMGVVRGAPLNANRLVHLPGFGDFQIDKIMSAPLSRSSKSNQSAIQMEVEPTVLAERDDGDGESLISENEPDTMANEQTWPTEDDMKMQGEVVKEGENGDPIPDAEKGTTPRRVRRVPKGMSEYQASWIVDDDDVDDEGDEDGEENESAMGMEDDGVEEEEEMVDMPHRDDDVEMDIESSSRKSVAFKDLDLEEESRQLDEWRKRARSEEEDAAFPDELDTPKDVPARTRFQRFRGLRSFRTSPWDPYENLPRDYARIFQFEDYRRSERSVRRRAEEAGGVEPGTRVTVILRNVPQEAASQGSKSPFVLFGLLQHEHKVTVLNFSVQRNTEYEEPVRSKDPLVLCVGPRRFLTNPVFSQHTRGGGKGTNNVHKFERWLRPGVTSIATTYAPVLFGHQPCVFLRETADQQSPKLVAMGTFVNTDTTRVIAKRIILTGHPFKVHKKTATVRYMFFNADDVLYFAPVQLHTKHGRTGHIRESLGTHGYFKAHFDGQVNQMDTVCMSLYKRVYPRWFSREQ